MVTFRYLLFLATVILCIRTAVAEAPKRYVGMLSDGTRVSGEQLRDWYNTEKMPHLDSQPLLAENKPLRWLTDLYLIPTPPLTSYVETVTGDRIPGRVVRFINSQHTQFHPQPSLLEVETTSRLKPQNSEQKTIRIDVSFVRRIVWEGTPGIHDAEKTCWYRDGRRVNYRSLRFAANHIDLLLADGVRKANFDDLAECNLPQRDMWDKYFEMLATLLPDLDGRLLQLETDDGLVVTGALAELRAYSQGNPSESRNWFHGIQPVWSPDVLWVPNENIRVRRCFDITEVPLSILQPLQANESSSLGQPSKRWQVNRNVNGGRLRSATLDFGWGIGVHATSELSFAIPPCVRQFRSHLGLDAIAGDGGCARGLVSINNTAPVYRSPHLIGSQTTTDIGTIGLPNHNDPQRKLVLTVDAAHSDRPKGADPFNIRDSVDWLDPTLIMDRNVLQQEVNKRRWQQIRATETWALETQPDKIRVQRTWDEIAPAPGRYEHAVTLSNEPFKLHRTLNITPEHRWLVIGTWRSGNAGTPPQVQVSVDMENVVEQEVPLRDRSHTDPQPLIIPVSDLPKDRPVSFDVTLQPGSEELPVHIETLTLTSQHPKLLSILDEQPSVTNIRQIAPPEPKTTSSPATNPHRFIFAGNRCARAAVDAPHTIHFAQPIKLREKPRWGEYRFIRFAIRKPGGRAILKYRQHASEVGQPPGIFIHTAGPGEALETPSREVRDTLPDEWIVITRDLVADFGEMDLESLNLEVVDGEAAYFDAIYLARSNPDFAEIPPP